jgi:hypothetical protein
VLETAPTLDAAPDDPFARRPVDEDTFLAVLDAMTAALEGAGVDHLLIGGIASGLLGRPRHTLDIDVLVRQRDAAAALDALDRAGFLTRREDEHWLYKGTRDGVLVDVIFVLPAGIDLDDEMWERSVVRELAGRALRLIGPEDLLIVKALAHDEENPGHWHDALGLIAAAELDWDHLVRRARRGPRRVLSLLLYAQSVDLLVPPTAIHALAEALGGL